jgi:hypothetical protein
MTIVQVGTLAHDAERQRPAGPAASVMLVVLADDEPASAPAVSWSLSRSTPAKALNADPSPPGS